MKEVYKPGAILPILFYCPCKTASNSGSSDNDRLKWPISEEITGEGYDVRTKLIHMNLTRACVSFHTNKITLSRRIHSTGAISLQANFRLRHRPLDSRTRTTRRTRFELKKNDKLESFTLLLSPEK